MTPQTWPFKPEITGSRHCDARYFWLDFSVLWNKLTHRWLGYVELASQYTLIATFIDTRHLFPCFNFKLSEILPLLPFLPTRHAIVSVHFEMLQLINNYLITLTLMSVWPVYVIILHACLVMWLKYDDNTWVKQSRVTWALSARCLVHFTEQKKH